MSSSEGYQSVTRRTIVNELIREYVVMEYSSRHSRSEVTPMHLPVPTASFCVKDQSYPSGDPTTAAYDEYNPPNSHRQTTEI